jgi:hypothetical protein
MVVALVRQLALNRFKQITIQDWCLFPQADFVLVGDLSGASCE